MSGVLYVTTTFPTIAWFIESEVHRLITRGVRVRVVTLRPIGTHYQPEHASLLRITECVGSPFDPRGWAALLVWLVRRPHRLVPEVARMLWASRSSAYALAGHLGYLPAAARVATLVERYKIERVHGAWAHFPASVAYLAARLTGRRFSMAAHAGSDLYRTQAFLAEKTRAADFVTACVRGNAEMLRALAGPAARVEWIYHGVDLTRFDGTMRARASEPTLLAVGKLSSAKGFDDAILSVAELARRGVAVRLDLVGEGPERERLEQLARATGVETKVRFLGELAHGELLTLYRSAWMLLAPSKVLASGRRDGIPNVVIEAMAMGVPCVGTRAAGLEEAIVAGETGALAAPSDPRSLADAIEPLLREPERLDRMGRAARARVAERFDAARNFERLYELMSGDGRAGSKRVAFRSGGPVSATRVMHVIEAMSVGGAESMVVEHSRHAGAGIETVVCALNRGGPALEAARASGARVHLLEKGTRRLGGLVKLARLMREERIEVVNGHNATGSFYATLAARLAGVPVVVRTEHSIHFPGRYSLRLPQIEGLLTVLTRRVVCVCQAVLESHVSRLPWAVGRFVTVANGISPAPHTRPREAVRSELGLEPGARVALNVGSLTPQKAQASLLEAFARVAQALPEARLLIAGDGPLRGELEALSSSLGLEDRVRFLGLREDAADLMEACDLFVLSSVREGLSITLLEAMRASRPAVATSIGGNGEAVDDGVTGSLVPVGDAAALGTALLSLLGDRQRAASFGAAGARRWAERFTAERMARETESIYRSELESLGRRPAQDPTAAGEHRASA